MFAADARSAGCTGQLTDADQGTRASRRTSPASPARVSPAVSSARSPAMSAVLSWSRF